MIAPKPLPLPHVCGDPEGFFEVEGGVCAAKGMVASGVHAGFRKNPERRDLALVASEDPAVMAATFTRNRFCAAPVQLSRERAAKGIARAVVLNSGNANAATGAMGLEVARASASTQINSQWDSMGDSDTFRAITETLADFQRSRPTI